MCVCISVRAVYFIGFGAELLVPRVALSSFFFVDAAVFFRGLVMLCKVFVLVHMP